MGKNNYSPKDFCNPRNTERVLKQNNCEIQNCNGSHRKSKLPDGNILVYPDHETGVGLGSKIFKILKAAGLLGIFILIVLINLM